MRKKIVSFILAVALVMTLFVSPVMAWSAKNTKCYTITTGNTTVYYSNSTSSGKKGTIFGSDEIKILSSYSNGFYYVDYPIAKGRKQGYILKSAVLINTSASTWYATSKITTYRRNSTSNTYGSIYKDDEVLVFGTRGNFTQIRYPVSGGYKFAWIRNTDANNYLKKTKTVNPTSVSLKVKITKGSMYADNSGFYLTSISSVAQMKAVVNPSNATNKSVTWSSGNTDIVKISSSGYVTPVSNGTTTITARTVNGKSASAKVTVSGISFNDYYVKALYEAASLYSKSENFLSLLFLFQDFNHRAKYDVKHEEMWKKVFSGYPYPYNGAKVLLFGKKMTAEDIGNAFYGSVGAYIGVSDRTLYQGGGLAKSGAKYLNSPPYYGDDKNDHAAIEYGISLIGGRSQKIDVNLNILRDCFNVKDGVKTLRNAAMKMCN